MTRRSLVVICILIAVGLVVAGLLALEYPRPSQHGQGDLLTSYGSVTDLTYQGTMISIVFTPNTDLSVYSAAISYTAANHAVSSQSYQDPQVPIGNQSQHALSKGDALTIGFDDIPAGGLLLNIDIQVNATVGAHNMLLSYTVSQLETNSSQ